MPTSTDTQSRHHESRYEHDTEGSSDARTRARAREDADGTLARLWGRLRAAFGWN